MHGLTHRQEQVLNSIKAHLATKGYPPTIRELGNHIGVRSTNGVNDHLTALERKGYLTRADTKSRGLRLTAKASGQVEPAPANACRVVHVDVYERVSAGSWPFLPHNIVDTVAVDLAMIGNAKGPFGVRVRGESMVGDGLVEGDVVFFSRQSEVQPGEVVCVVLGDEAILRRIHPEKEYVRLQPSNPTVPDLLVRQQNWHPRLVLGVARGMLRRLPVAGC
jgi:repressor LexA